MHVKKPLAFRQWLSPVLKQSALPVLLTPVLGSILALVVWLAREDSNLRPGG